jgi:hypothetical protein
MRKIGQEPHEAGACTIAIAAVSQLSQQDSWHDDAWGPFFACVGHARCIALQIM